MKALRFWMATASLLGVVALLSACGSEDPTATPTPEPTATALPGAVDTPTPDADAVFQARWDDLIARAQEEGEIVFGGAWGINDRPWNDLFARTFDVKVIEGVDSGSQAANKIIAERNAGLYLVDGWNRGGGSSRRLIAAQAFRAEDGPESFLFHPDALDLSKWLFNRWFWVTEDYTDPQGKHGKVGLYSDYQMTEAAGVGYNTKTVSRELLDSITSYRDFLRPEIVEITVVQDPFVAGATGTRTRMWSVMGPEYMEELVRTYHAAGNLITFNDSSVITGLGRGKWDMALFPGGFITDLVNAGLPFAELVPDERLLEGGMLPNIGGGESRMVFDRAPHPAAAELYWNWFYTQEGATAKQTLNINPNGPRPSLRLDVPQGTVPDVEWNARPTGDDIPWQSASPPGAEYDKIISDSLQFGLDLYERMGLQM